MMPPIDMNHGGLKGGTRLGWIEPVSTAIAAAGIVNDLAKASRSIKRHANRIVYRIRSGTIDLPIFGCGGAGKSTAAKVLVGEDRSEEHTSELQSLMRNSYAVFCLKKKKQIKNHTYTIKRA